MLSLKAVVEQAGNRFDAEIEAAEKAKDVDPARIKRRRNEMYFTRLTRASLPLSQNYELTDPCYSLCVALPELMFAKMYFLGWGAARSQKKVPPDAPQLLREYSELFVDFQQSHFESMLDAHRSHQIDYALICHGLSPTSDTILLLADLGRSLRIAYALGITEAKVLLADVSWIKYNRSITQVMDRKDFLNALRICLDKRKRLYKALGLPYRVFGISDYGADTENLNRTELEELTTQFRQLALALWGENSLKPHNPDMKRVIGAPLYGIRKSDRSALPPQIATLISYPTVASAVEKSLESELSILRTISELFSSFDEEVFVYYFAQYFAQSRYARYVKIAPISENKFDLPFATKSKHFASLAPARAEANNQDGEAPVDVGSFQIYYPQYKLGRYELLPYTSTSGDVLRHSVGLSEFLSNTVLLDDSYDNRIDKIIGVFTETPIANLNRVVADLFSFVHVLFLRCPSARTNGPLRKAVQELDWRIAEQLYSEQDTPEGYAAIYADWLKAIEHEDAVLPFHVIPFLWEDKDWDKVRLQRFAQFAFATIAIVNDICE